MIRLIAAGPEDFRALRLGRFDRARVPEGGLEPEPVLAMLEAWSARLRQAQGWGHWLALSGDEVVASLAVKDPPDQGMVELGYAVAPARRGRGLGTAAVTALLPVLRGHGVTRVRAETSPHNPASARVLLAAGFVPQGHRLDSEDGLLALWSHDLSGLTPQSL